MGRYSLNGHGVWNADFSTIKNLRITEKQSVQFRFEGFNILNHPALGSPNMNWGGRSQAPSNPNFGQIRDFSGDAGFQEAAFSVGGLIAARWGQGARSPITWIT
jgi:hypothetical protein